jgi:hypothetical protein
MQSTTTSVPAHVFKRSNMPTARTDSGATRIDITEQVDLKSINWRRFGVGHESGYWLIGHPLAKDTDIYSVSS